MYGNRIAETTLTTAGTGNVTLNGAKEQHATVASKYAVGQRLPYVLLDANGSGYEIGVAALLSGGILDRANAVIEDSTNAGARISLSSGIHEVFVPVTSRSLEQATTAGQGIRVTDLALSLGDQGRQPSYTQGGINVRKYDQKGPLSWLKRWTKNGFVYHYSAGKSGDTIEGSLARVFADVIDQPKRPDHVVLWLGGNDINGMTTYAAAEAELAVMKSELNSIIQILRHYGIVPHVWGMPNNGVWIVNNHAMWAQAEWEQYLIELNRTSRLGSFVNFGPLLSVPLACWLTDGLSMTRASNVVTVTWNGHPFVTGDRVTVFGSSDISFDNIPAGALVTVVNASSFTYPDTGGNGNSIGSAVKVNVLQNLASDGTTHLSAKGAHRAAKYALPSFQKWFPPVDILSASENDFRNLIGFGKTAAQFRPNLGMFDGNSGTETGTPLPTGDVARNWEVRSVSGVPSSVVCSKVTHPRPEYSQYPGQQIVITAGGTDCEVSLLMAHTIPSNWSPSLTAAAGSYRKPTTPNGFFYVNINTVDGTTGTTEPVWPTRLGERVVDGTVTWECRLGIIPGVTQTYAAAEYYIAAATDNATIKNINWGINDDTTGGDSILDFNNNSDVDSPTYEVGELYPLCTPTTTLGATGTAFSIGAKVRVAANKSATIQFFRATWRVV